MTNEEGAAMNDICRRIAEEKDPAPFHHLVVQLNDLLENRQNRLEDRKSKVN
jgi:hypothetical protein